MVPWDFGPPWRNLEKNTVIFPINLTRCTGCGLIKGAGPGVEVGQVRVSRLSEHHSPSYKGVEMGYVHPGVCYTSAQYWTHRKGCLIVIHTYSQWTGGSLGRCGRNTKKTEHFKKTQANWSPVSQPAERKGGMKVVKGVWIDCILQSVACSHPAWIPTLSSLPPEEPRVPQLCICHSHSP